MSLISTLTERGAWWGQGSLPDRITVFRNPTLAICDTRDDVVHVSYGYGLFTGGLGLLWLIPWAVFYRQPRESRQITEQERELLAASNAEEEQAGLADKAPWLLESRLREAGATFSSGDAWAPFVVVDDKLVTGQNPHMLDA